VSSYLVRRLLLNIPMFFGITFVVFFILRLAPGDPIGMLINPDAGLTPEQLDALRRQFGFDKPLWVQYLAWLNQLVHGNLGYRTSNFDPVAQAVGDRIGPTLLLMGTAFVLGTLVGVALGVFASLRQYSWLDWLLTLLAYIGVSLPGFFVGLGALYLFALRLHWVPAGGLKTPGIPHTIGDVLHHLILPALILGFGHLATVMRYTRSTMLEVLNADYVTTAKAKGLARRNVVIGHALRNALLPVVTVLGLAIPSLLGGSIIIESVFSWPGMGQLFLDGVLSRDYPVIMGITLVTAILVLFGNLVTDLAYAYLDPRIRFE